MCIVMIILHLKVLRYAHRNWHDRIEIQDFEKLRFDHLECDYYKIFLKWNIKKLGHSFHVYTLEMMYCQLWTSPSIVVSTILINVSVLTNRGKWTSKCESSFTSQNVRVVSLLTFLLFVEEWIWIIVTNKVCATIAPNLQQGAFGWWISSQFWRIVSFGGTHRL